MKKIAITFITIFTLNLIAVANDVVLDTSSEIEITEEMIQAEMKKIQTNLTAEEIFNLVDDLETITSDSQNIQQNIANLEEQLELIKEEIANIDTEINSSMSGKYNELEQYGTDKIDIAETEVVNGDVFQIDIYDLGQKFSEQDKEDFFAKYNI